MPRRRWFKLGGKKKKKELGKEKVVRKGPTSHFTKLAQLVALVLALAIVAGITGYRVAKSQGWTPAEMWAKAVGKSVRPTDFQCNVLLGKFREADSLVRTPAALAKADSVMPEFLKYAGEISKNCGGYAERMGGLKLDLYREARHDELIARH